MNGALDHAPRVPGATSHRGVVYAERRGFRPLLLDAHVPQDPAGPRGAMAPWVLWVHGGGWDHGDRRTTAENWPEGWFLGTLVAAGLGVVTVDYRLSAEATHPAALEDVVDALRFVRRHADALGLDPDGVGVAGDSAGGHLAALAALTLAGTAESVQAAALLYAVTDLPRMLDVERVAEHERADSPEARMLGGLPEDDVDLARHASPVHHAGRAGPDTPPLLLLTGDRDTVVPADQSERLARALHEAGATDVVLELVPGADHCFEGVDPVPPLRRVVDFLAQRLLHAPTG